jgi:hypothetical protein
MTEINNGWVLLLTDTNSGEQVVAGPFRSEQDASDFRLGIASDWEVQIRAFELQSPAAVRYAMNSIEVDDDQD